LEEGAKRTEPGTFDSLIAADFSAAEFKTLAASTQHTYRGVIELFRREHRGKPVARLEAHHVQTMIDAKAETPAAANNLRRMLRMLLRFAVERNWRRDNPVLAVRKLSLHSDGLS
jgi:site-specific recombinase XerD